MWLYWLVLLYLPYFWSSLLRFSFKAYNAARLSAKNCCTPCLFFSAAFKGISSSTDGRLAGFGCSCYTIGLFLITCYSGWFSSSSASKWSSSYVISYSVRSCKPFLPMYLLTYIAFDKVTRNTNEIKTYFILYILFKIKLN